MEISIEDRLIYNNNKLVADKIRKTLLNIRNISGISAKRWVWEMIQNAKDVPNNFGKVDIKIELTKNSLIFSHNGSYFLVDNILGILQQVSSKDSKNVDGQTGKFGTGFIGTHLLSTIVKIKGIVKYRGIFRKFNIYLDRSAESSEELAKEVSKSILEFKNNMNNENSDFELLSTYNQKETDFDTCFEYILKDENSIQIAKEGINDLINTGPVTMATQCKKISSIFIHNEIDNEEYKYTISCSKKKKNINLYTSTISSNKNEEKKLYFFSYENEFCRLLYEIEPKNDSYIVVEQKKGQPILFRDFPLIGSENFHFPFFLDGFKFNPLETRNGLFLNGILNKEAIENREILEKAIEAAIEFSKYIISQTNNKLYCLAKTNIPEPPQRYDKYAIDWFITQQKKWRNELLKLNLIRDDENSYSELKELKLPQFQNKLNMDFYKLMKRINLTEGIIPHEEDINSWYEILEYDPLKEVYEIKENTWGFNYLFKEEELFSKIESYKTINNFAQEFQKTTSEILDWLNDLYKLLNENNCKDYLNKYRLIPNQNGVFLKGYEIFGNNNNKEDKIPPILNPIYKEISVGGKEIFDIIVHEKIIFENLDKFIEKKNLVDVFHEFSNFFKNKENDNKIKEYLCNKFISFSINNDKIKQMFDFRKDIEPKNEYKRKEELNYYCEGHNLWKEVEEFWFDFHSKIIEGLENINNLSMKLHDNQIKTKETYEWINNYITFFKKNSNILEQKKIFPNKNGDFKLIKDLRSAIDIPEILIDYENELKRIKEKDYDKRITLLSNEIKEFEGYNRLSQKEIISDIETLFNTTDDAQDTKIKISEQIMSLLPKSESDKFKTIKNALKDFIVFYNQIFNKNIVQKEEDVTVSLDYGIFVSYVLEKIYKKIELMNSNEISSKIEIISKIIKFSWDYQFNNDFRVNIDPKEYKIFINQYNQQKYIKDIYIKKNFRDIKYSDVENQLFELAKSSIIGKDYPNLFLANSLDKELEAKYEDNFKPIEFGDVCNYIDSDIVSYANHRSSLADVQNKHYREIFFKLNEILKNNSFLKSYFSRFLEERGQISVKFLVSDEKEMDKFVEDVKSRVDNKT